MIAVRKKDEAVFLILFVLPDVYNKRLWRVFCRMQNTTILFNLLIFLPMKRIYVFLLLGLFTNILTSCSNDPLYPQDFSNNSDELSGEIVEGRNLTLQQAMNNLNFIARNIDGNGNRRVESVDLLQVSDFSKNGITTMSSSDTEGEMNQLAYVVNFADNNGYAILGANAGVPPVLVLGDDGSFSTQDYLSFLESEPIKANKQTLQTVQSGQMDPKKLQYMMVTSAILSSSQSAILPGGNVTIKLGRDTSVLLKCNPLVRTKWDQAEPYNYYSPTSGSGVKYLAGCLPIAAAQILAAMTYHQNLRPTVTISNNYAVDWEAIADEMYAGTVRYQSTTTNALKVASLIRAIGDYVDADYSSSSTSVYVPNLESLFAYLGFDNATLDWFDKNDAFDMIVRQQLPLFVGAQERSTNAGHAFILDGWLRLEYTFDRMPIGGASERTRESFDLVHCNFGFDGMGDGYYTPGAFNLSRDNNNDEKEDNDFPWYGEDTDYSVDIYQITFNYSN
ncbi:MAG TPA: C10 family peptidase [Candidatus Alistipes avicola]|uniref:C10 family peptidase n=1 Tax=Candidatus Alistipes avicola TaxID=2838432 RepID=A0A9D2L3X2_9BACT|nr:C10 family peptidase [Candidatus Alistipes avicola]